MVKRTELQPGWLRWLLLLHHCSLLLTGVKSFLLVPSCVTKLFLLGIRALALALIQTTG